MLLAGPFQVFWVESCGSIQLSACRVTFFIMSSDSLGDQQWLDIVVNSVPYTQGLKIFTKDLPAEPDVGSLAGISLHLFSPLKVKYGAK
jgi:hypothetical protein